MISARFIDLVAILLFLLFVLSGIRRGFILTLCSILAYFSALLAASYAAEQASPWLAEHLQPGIETFLSEQMESILSFGGEEILSSTAQAMAEKLAAVILYVAVFVVVLYLLHWVGRLLNLVARLPVIHLFNRIGGGILGAGKGWILLIFFVTLFHALGLLPQSLISETVVVQWLAGWSL